MESSNYRSSQHEVQCQPPQVSIESSTTVEHLLDQTPGSTSLQPMTPEKQLRPLHPSFSDRKIDRVTPNRNRPMTPSSRRNCNPLFLRRMSVGSSSGEESPLTQGSQSGTRQRRISVRHSSPESGNNSSRQVAYLVGTSRLAAVSDNQEETESVCPKTVLMEVSRDLESQDDNRPPSPRPSGELQNCVEHNKQMQVWDDWVTLANTDSILPVASISFKRVESERHIMMKPKSLTRLRDDEDSDMEQ